MFGRKTYELSLTREYVSSWGLVEAVRELLQNALDSESPFEYAWHDQRDGEEALMLTIRSRFTTLPASALLLGASSKAGRKDAIGSFGEGFKIALLVLTRLGLRCVMRNGPVDWEPAFRTSSKFGREVLVIDETPARDRHEGLEVQIMGLPADAQPEIEAICLPMQPKIGRTLPCSQGTILFERPGRLFVGGLFICEMKGFKYGYDIKPEHLRLERDRGTVSSFDLAWLTKGMWFEHAATHADEIAEMITSEAKEMEYANFGAPEIVREACYAQFREMHPGKLVAENKAELKAAVAQGLTKYVSVGGWGAIVKSAPSYIRDVSRPGSMIATPTERLTAWFEANKYRIHEHSRGSFRDLIKESQGWQVKDR